MTSSFLKHARLLATLTLALGCGLAQAQSRCQQISAKSTSDKLLIIAFEGLGQYQQGPIDQLYKAQADHTNNLPQLAGWGDLITGGLLSPLVRQYGNKIEVMVYAHDEGDQGRSCAEEWLKGGAGRRVMLIGHSAGGPTANDVANNLVSAGLPVDSVFTIDSCGLSGLSRPRGVALWDNFYERNAGCMGFPPQTMGSTATVEKNVGDEAGHMNITNAPSVVHAVEAQITKDISGT